MDTNPELISRLAELQRLCERAHTFICETWDGDPRAKVEYGPTSLIRYLEKASKGKELRDIRALADACIKANHSLDIRNGQLQAERDRYKNALEEISKGEYYGKLGEPFKNADVIAQQALKGGSDE